MNDDIDLDFRPGTYFRPQRLEQYLLSRVKGAVLKKRLRALFREGRHAEATLLLGPEGIPEDDAKALEAIHPMYMGGNYLPNMDEGEVEIARIRIASTTYDVTSAYARREDGVIRYRIVDEYGGDTLSGTTEMTSDKPLSLREFTDFFLNAWPLVEVLENNYEDDLDAALDFFSAESDFYADFHRVCRRRVIDAFPTAPEGN